VQLSVQYPPGQPSSCPAQVPEEHCAPVEQLAPVGFFAGGGAELIVSGKQNPSFRLLSPKQV
jgi:hypothetical protein